MQEVPPFLWSDAGTFTSPKTYTVPGAGEVQPYTATATYVNASGQAILPALRIKSAEGALLALVFPSTSVANGATSEVTFVPPFGSAAVSADGQSFAGLPAARVRAGFATYGPGPTFAAWDNSFKVSPDGVFTADSGTNTRVLLHDVGLYLFVGLWLPSGAQTGANTYTVDITDNGGSSLGGVTLIDQRDASVGTPQHITAGTGSGVVYISGSQSFPLRIRGRLDCSVAQNYSRIELDVFQMRPTDDLA